MSTPWMHRLDRRLAEIDRQRTDVLPAERALAIAEAVAAFGRGGRDAVAQYLQVSVGAVDQALRRARDRSLDPARGLPADTLPRLLDLELTGVPGLPRAWWELLSWVVRGTVIDVVWIEQPGELLAQEVEDADLPAGLDDAALAVACRSWTRVQALAVLDRCQHADLDSLPTTDPAAVSQ